MKICKARITQCSGRNFWYRNMVGQEVFTARHPDPQFGFRHIPIGAHDCMPMGEYFAAHDLEIVEEFDGGIVERVTIEIVRKVGSGDTAVQCDMLLPANV